MKKPLWKIVTRRNSKYAEMLIRCKPEEFKEERDRLEQIGSVQQATVELLRSFSNSPLDLSAIISEMKAQHEAQLEAIKTHLKTHFSALVSVSSEARNGQDVDGYIDEIWESIES
jgi:DNA-directed RNA polymerase subunit F